MNVTGKQWMAGLLGLAGGAAVMALVGGAVSAPVATDRAAKLQSV